MISFVKAIGDLPNTFWGIVILFCSMYLAVKYNLEIGYYFAGVGSTLVGINHLQPQPNTRMTIGTDPSIKVDSNASDTPS
jgi:TM2 domain-containing membrane protein YozV